MSNKNFALNFKYNFMFEQLQYIIFIPVMLIRKKFNQASLLVLLKIQWNTCIR